MMMMMMVRMMSHDIGLDYLATLSSDHLSSIDNLLDLVDLFG